MNRSPLVSSVIALVPLIALGWPLAKVINVKPYVQNKEITEEVSGPIRSADLEVRSAHSFQNITVSIGEATWNFAPGEDRKEIHFPLSDNDEVTLQVSVTWPDKTPESAVFLELLPEGLENRSTTLWGLGEVTDEVKFSWEITE